MASSLAAAPDAGRPVDPQESAAGESRAETNSPANAPAAGLLSDCDAHHTTNPNLFEETYHMTAASAFIFGFAEIRRAARAGVIDGSEVQTLPISGSELLRQFARTKDRLRGKIEQDDFEYLEWLIGQYEKDTGNEGTDGSNGIRRLVDAAVVHHFGDDKGQECVYSISANSERKIITLAFRGSVTITDWLQDSKIVIGKIKNPLTFRPDQPDTLGVHLGFREYLYSKNSLSETVTRTMKRTTRHIVRQADALGISASQRKGQSESDNQDEPQSESKLDTVLDQLRTLLNEHPDYNLYVTGHSLGGALAILAALEAACVLYRPDHPVTLVTVGNPRAATAEYRTAVQTLEKEGRMRCIGVHNAIDIVPKIPVSMFSCRLCNFHKREFCQVGFDMVIDGSGFTVTYCGKKTFAWTSFRRKCKHLLTVLFRADQIKTRHHYMTYLALLQGLKDQLRKMNLNDLYNDIVDPGLYPKLEVSCT